MRHLTYKSKEKLSPWRKISIGSWRPTGDSSTYCFEDIEVEQMLSFCKEKNIGVNTFFILAAAKTINKKDKINSVVRWGKIYKRKDINIFMHVLPHKDLDDLSGLLIKNPHEKSLKEISEDYINQINEIRSLKDRYTRSKKTFNRVHPFFSKKLLDFLSYITYTLNIYHKSIPSSKDSFGSIMITPAGGMDLQRKLNPIAPYTRIPMIISLGKINERPVAKNGKVLVAKMITLGITFDHRIMDGYHIAEFIKVLRAYVETPSLIEK